MRVLVVVTGAFAVGLFFGTTLTSLTAHMGVQGRADDAADDQRAQHPVVAGEPDLHEDERRKDQRHQRHPGQFLDAVAAAFEDPGQPAGLAFEMEAQR